MALQSRADDVSFDIFSGRLLQESARRQVAHNSQQPGGQSTPAAAFTVRLPAHGRGGQPLGRGRGGMRMQTAFSLGLYDASLTAGRDIATRRGKGKCFYCHKEGHWKRDCYKRKNDEAKETTHHSPNSQTSLAFIVAENHRQDEDPGRLILDSGRSQHLGGRKNYFIPGTYREISQRVIEIANRSKIAAIGICEMSIGQLRLSGVIYVPHVAGNLISVARLIDSGYEVSFGTQLCTISNKRIQLRAQREGNLYYLQGQPRFAKANIGLATNKAKPVTLEVWHRRLGHRTLDQNTIQFLQPRVSEFVIESIKHKEMEKEICGTGAIGRQHREAMTGAREKAVELLEVVHSDIGGPMQVNTISGERYFITFIDERSGRIAITLLKSKNKALGAFQAYKIRAEKEAGKEIRAFKTDGGGEYINHQFKSYLRNCGMAYRISPPYTPRNNGLAERANRTLMESARCMIADGQIDKAFWGFAVATAAHIHNRIPSRSYGDISPLQHWTGKPPSIGYLRVFGSVTYTLIPAEKGRKLDPKSAKCTLLGYDEEAESNVYRVYDQGSNRIFCPSDVIINEGRRNTVSEGIAEEDEMEIQLPEVREKGVGERTLENLAEQDSYVATRNEPDLEGFGGITIIVRPPHRDNESRGRMVSLPGPRRSERQRNPSQHTYSEVPRAMIAHLDEPHTLKEALVSDDTDNWFKAWESEVDSLVRNKTWELSPLPAGREAIGCRWLFKLKEDGQYKVRLVAKGYGQQAGLDYTETFAPVAKFTSLRSLLALVAENDWELEGMDVKTAFLHSEHEETDFMEIPEGLHMDMPVSDSQKEDRIACHLNKAI